MIIFFYSLIPFAYWPFAFQSTIPKIDEVLVSMTNIDPVHRLNAREAKDRLGTVVNSMAPESLLIKPETLRNRPESPNKQVQWEVLTTKVGQSGCVTIVVLGICDSEEQWLMNLMQTGDPVTSS